MGKQFTLLKFAYHVMGWHHILFALVVLQVKDTGRWLKKNSVGVARVDLKRPMWVFKHCKPACWLPATCKPTTTRSGGAGLHVHSDALVMLNIPLCLLTGLHR